MMKHATPETSADEVVLDRLAHNIETLRSQHGWSRAVLAKRSGVSTSQLKHIVHRRANPSVADVLRIANAFEVRISELTDREIEGASPLVVAASVTRYDAVRFDAAFGGRLRALRKRRGLSIRPLAMLANIARNTLRSVETSGVGPGTRVAVRIAHALGMSFGDFVESLHSSVLAFTPNGAEPGGQLRNLLQDTGAGDVLRMEELALQRGHAVQRPACGPGSTTMAYAIEGSVRIVFASESVALRPGEAALLASDRDFLITAFGARSARLLMVVRTADAEPSDEVA